MAKLKGKAKAAFLRRMALGRARKRRRHPAHPRAKYRRVTGGHRRIRLSGTMRPSKKTPGVVRIQLRQNPLSALIANPGGALMPYSPRYAAYQKAVHEFYGRKKKKRKSPRKSASRPKSKSKKRRTTMAKKSKRRAGRPRRRARRYLQRAIRVPRRYARKYYKPKGKRRIYINPRRRRRNPGFGGGSLLKRVLVPYAAGFIASGLTAVLDTGLANYPMVKHVAKVGAAFAIAILARNKPVIANAAIAGIAGTMGYGLGTMLAGGFIAQSPAQAMKGLGDMSAQYPEIGALLNGGVGALLNGMGGGADPAEEVVANYQTALNNMADEDY